MTEILIRRSARKQRNFTIIDNQIIEHPLLTWEARMILIYLLSKPDNWRVQHADIMNRGNFGKNKIYGILKELITHGYIQRSEVRIGGRFVRYEYVVHEDPAGAQKKPRGANNNNSPLPQIRETVSVDDIKTTQDAPLPENREMVKGQKNSVQLFAIPQDVVDNSNNSPLPQLPLPVSPLPVKRNIVSTEYNQGLNQAPHTHIAEIAPELITVDWIPSPEIVKQIAFNAGVSEVDVFNDAIGFAGHFNGQEVFNVGGELLKWVNREKRYRAKNRG